MTWRIDLLIVLSILIVSSCVPSNEPNKKQKQTSINSEKTVMVSAQDSNKDKGKDKDDKDDDSNHNSKDTTPPSLPGFATFNKFYNASNFPLQFAWGVSVDANLSGYNYKFCGTSDCRTSCKVQQSSLGTIPSGIISFDGVIEGMNYACVQAFDKYKNITSFVNVGSFTVDTIAPIASTFKLQSSGSHKDFSNKNIISWIAGSVTGAAQMCLTNSLSSTNCNWISVGTSGNYTLPTGVDGLRTVYLYYRDEALNISKPVSATITLDLKAPTNVALSITNSEANIIGGVDSNFDHYVIRFCDSPDCTNVLSRLQSKTMLFNLAEMIALNKTFYTAVYSIDLADNISNVTIVAYTPTPTIPTTPSSLVKDITTNGYTTCALSTSGKVKCWGANSVGELGNGQANGPNHTGVSPDEMGDNLPYVDLGNDFIAVQLSLGGTTACALSTKGAIKCWGDNYKGQIGIGVKDRSIPFPTTVDVGSDRPVHISVGGGHTCIATTSGAVKCWGENNFGQLGINSTETIGDDPGEMGENLKAIQIGDEFVTKVSAGGGFTCALLNNNMAKCWGQNTDGQLGVRDFINVGSRPGDMKPALPYIWLSEGISEISAGNFSACARFISGKAKCWGNNYYGNLGQGDTTNARLDAIPYIDFGKSKVTQISTQGDATCALLDNGEAKCWGRNETGNLGQGNTTQYFSPSAVKTLDVGTGNKIAKISSSNLSTCVLLTNGQVKCWGLGLANFSGIWNYVGDGPDEMGDNLLPLDLGF